MKEHPIIFSGPMVREILAGHKTMTRRVVQWTPIEPGMNLTFSGLRAGHYCTGEPSSGWVLYSMGGSCWQQRTKPQRCPYGVPGDRLWVREAWRQAYAKTTFSEGIVYRADKEESLGMDEYSDRHVWRPSIFMPRAASRITLEVTGVRVERLQDISTDDAIAEGSRCGSQSEGMFSHRHDFERIWDTINAKRAPWASNPWVWVVQFCVINQQQRSLNGNRSEQPCEIG